MTSSGRRRRRSSGSCAGSTTPSPTRQAAWRWIAAATRRLPLTWIRRPSPTPPGVQMGRKPSKGEKEILRAWYVRYYKLKQAIDKHEQLLGVKPADSE